MREERTTDLEHILSGIRLSQMREFIDQYGQEGGNPRLYGDYIAAKGISSAQIVKKCAGLLSKSYVYDLINAKKCNPSRDVVLILCISAGMDRKLTRRMLENYGHRDLYPKDTRDIIIATHINNGDFDLDAVNAELLQYQMAALNQEHMEVMDCDDN